LAPHWTDVPYANASPAQKMDIYLPNSKGPYPVVIWIHDGGFESGDKSGNESKLAKEALLRGYAVVSINYRLSKDAKFPAQINDVKAAIRFLRANAKKYNLNPDKTAVWGNSAGEGLAALAGTSGNVEELQNNSLGYSNVSDQVQAVVDQKGPINFNTMLLELQNDTGQNNSMDYNASHHMLNQLREMVSP
jgi:acetyl esterase/lipase